MNASERRLSSLHNHFSEYDAVTARVKSFRFLSICNFVSVMCRDGIALADLVNDK
jgi:hypothetical protein